MSSASEAPIWDVMTFGETMLRLSPPGFGRIESAISLDFSVGGSESNTAVALARLGRKATWWSRLPKTTLGRKVAQEVSRWGVDTSHVIWTESGRVGTYYIEFGAPPRAHRVHYDRADSEASRMLPDEFDWNLLASARRLHTSGITAALSPNCLATTARAFSEAKSRNVACSMDVNFRSKLWTSREAAAGLAPLITGIDLVLCAQPDASLLFGITGAPMQVAKQICQTFGCRVALVTAGIDGIFAWSADGEAFAPIVVATEVDRVGAGDACTAGVLNGLLDGDIEKAVRYGSAMSSLKHTIPGDLMIADRSEIEALLAGVGAAIQR